MGARWSLATPSPIRSIWPDRDAGDSAGGGRGFQRGDESLDGGAHRFECPGGGALLPSGEVEVDRPPRGAALGNDLREGRGVVALPAEQVSGRRHHLLLRLLGLGLLLARLGRARRGGLLRACHEISLSGLQSV